MEARYILRMRPRRFDGRVSHLLLSEREGLFAGDEREQVHNSPKLSYPAGLFGRVRSAFLLLHAASCHQESFFWVSLILILRA